MGKEARFSLSPPKTELAQAHKCDRIKVPQLVDRFWASDLPCKDSAKQRNVALSTDDPLTVFNQEALMTQCCVNQKYHHCRLMPEEHSAQSALFSRNIRCGFREYFFAFKWLKTMNQKMQALHASIHAKQYQIAILKEDVSEEKMPLLGLPIKMEERHFRMGHTIKHH